MVEQKGDYLSDETKARVLADMHRNTLENAVERIAKPFGLDEVLFRLDSIAYLAEEMGHCEHQITDQLETVARIIRTYQPCDWIDAARLIEDAYFSTQSFLYRNPEKYASAPRVHSFLMGVESRVRDSPTMRNLAVVLDELFLDSSPSAPPAPSISSYRTEGQLKAMEKINPDY